MKLFKITAIVRVKENDTVALDWAADAIHENLEPGEELETFGVTEATLEDIEAELLDRA